MAFLAAFLRGISFVPSVVQGAEAIFGAKTGADKKQSALNFVSSAINITDAITNKSIIDPNSFNTGLSQVIDGVVACLNASLWNKTTTTSTASVSPVAPAPNPDSNPPAK